MPTKTLFNSVVNWFIKQRISQIESFIKEPHKTQEAVLFSHLLKAENTLYGKEYNFKEIANITDFQTNVPIVTYEDFEPYIERTRRGEKDIIWAGSIKMFAKSSGTTNAKSKYIPITEDSLNDCHYKAGKDLISIYANNHPENKLFSNKNLRLGGSSEMYENFNTKYGDLSAILIDNLPFWVEITTVPSKKVSLMSEWESKIKAIVKEVVKADVGSLSGVPSWMMVLLQKVLETSGDTTIEALWPNLEVFFHGGISFKPYKKQYKELIGREINYYEIYNASEGFFGIQDRHKSDELLLMLDYGIFYEFIKMEDFNKSNPRVYTISEVETNVNYALLITTNGGLWRYLIGDTIYFTSLNPYRIKISGRTKHHINVFGEELMIDNVETALEIVCHKTNASVKDYTGAPVFMTDKNKGTHEWIFEFSKEPDDFELFKTEFDTALKSLNSDYEAKRYNDMTLRKPIIHKGRQNLFFDWMEKRGKLGGQNKVPRLSNERDYLEPLLEMNQMVS